MKFLYTSVGGGISGIETALTVINELFKKSIHKKKPINIAIIDKNPENIPGGVAYGFDISKYGFFNNPIRLSPKEFVNWLSTKKGKHKILSYLKIYGGYTGENWIKKNKKILLSNNRNKFSELYVPRALSNIWMEEKLISLLKRIKKAKSKISIKFFKGEIVKCKNYKNNYKKLYFKDNMCKELNYKISNHPFKKLIFKEKKKIESIYSKTLNLGLGLPPPNQLASLEAQKSNNYIWDFYSEGSTSFLLKKIQKFKKNKKRIIYFIGYKAGLLEALPELKKVIEKKKLNLQLVCSSKNLKSIEKAELSGKKFVLRELNNKNLKRITKAKLLYRSIIKEFDNSREYNFFKYDAWTEILKSNVLEKCISKFNDKQKNLYDKIYHSKIRNITRFTYPETIIARELLAKKNTLLINKEKVKKVSLYNKKLIVSTINENNKVKKYICDIVVNVSGPLNVKSIKNEILIVKYLKSEGAKVGSSGFLVDKTFQIRGIKNVYTSGILASNFNPHRKTIFNAILKNSKIMGKNIAKVSVRL